jgi:Tol biopolymer transport system component
MNAINNPDYSHQNGKIIFSAQLDQVFHNYLFTIDLDKNLEQITDDKDYMDFDCSWSEDATLIAFNRLPAPWFEHPAQIWMMNGDGTNLRQMTAGGSNPDNEDPHRRYPIGTDADADLSPDNSHIVFSRLKTGRENEPIGVWELVVIEVETGAERVLDSSYANMVPEWKSGGILFTRQIGGEDPMLTKQVLYLYREDQFLALESFPFDVFPIGAFGGSWVE